MTEVRSQELAPAGLPSNGSIGGFKQGAEFRSQKNTSRIILFCILYSVFCVLPLTACGKKAPPKPPAESASK